MFYELRYPSHPPFPLGGGGKVRGHLKWVLRIYLGFVILDLEFKIMILGKF
jgi:hypothetical protein